MTKFCSFPDNPGCLDIVNQGCNFILIIFLFGCSMDLIVLQQHQVLLQIFAFLWRKFVQLLQIPGSYCIHRSLHREPLALRFQLCAFIMYRTFWAIRHVCRTDGSQVLKNYMLHCRHRAYFADSVGCNCFWDYSEGVVALDLLGSGAWLATASDFGARPSTKIGC